MKLFILHNHFRPGGVRRLVELATPHLVRAARPQVHAISLVAGERPDAEWLRAFARSVPSVPVSCRIHPAARYFAEQHQTPGRVTAALRRFLAALLSDCGPAEAVVWAHNQGLGRNLLLTRELVRVCAWKHLPLLLHHHDWWFDNRWQRWPEMRRAGFRMLGTIARTVFPAGANVRAVAVNRADTIILKRHFGRRAAWWPNPADSGPVPGPRSVRRARDWLRCITGETTPVWLMPCRLVRRKNIAEALLLTRWLRPEAWLVTTGGISSPDEAPYAERLAAAARRNGWKLRLGILSGGNPAGPGLSELMAASEAILLTSLQEGFGFPYIEAAAARRPLVARMVSNMAPDLKTFGFRLPHAYDEILIAPALFDWTAERGRQLALFAEWLARLPRSCRGFVRPPPLARAKRPRPVAFSRLTLTAQLEVLAHPAADSLVSCAPLNSSLRAWRTKARAGKLAVATWPATAGKWLSGLAYVRRFSKLLEPVPAVPQSHAKTTPRSAQRDFLRARLHWRNLYPILWSIDT